MKIRGSILLALASAASMWAQAGGSMPSEPGMYVSAPHGFVRIIGQSTAFKRSGSRAVSAVTLGIKASKENVQLPGPHAKTAVDPSAEFYFIPAKNEAENGITAGDLVLVKVEEEAGRRHFEVGARGIARESSGVSITHQVETNSAEPKPGVYRIKPAIALPTGEYAFYLNRGEKLTGYVYDFSVGYEAALPGTATAVPTTPAPAGAVTPAPAGAVAPAPAGATESGPTAGAGSGKCSLRSMPDGADITVDGSFVGSTPSTISLAAGKHSIIVSLKGYKDWQKDITISGGSEITLRANMVRQ